MGKDLFSVLETLSHFSIGTFQGCSEGVVTSFSFLVDIGYHLILGTKMDFRLIGKVYLNYLVTQSEHDGMTGLHPFLHIDRRCPLSIIPIHSTLTILDRARLIGKRIEGSIRSLRLLTFQITTEVLQQGYLLL